jgi:hypothetical protein
MAWAMPAWRHPGPAATVLIPWRESSLRFAPATGFGGSFHREHSEVITVPD